MKPSEINLKGMDMCPDCLGDNPCVDCIKQFLADMFTELEKKRYMPCFSIEMRQVQEFEGMKIKKNGEFIKLSDIEKIFKGEKK